MQLSCAPHTGPLEEPSEWPTLIAAVVQRPTSGVWGSVPVSLPGCPPPPPPGLVNVKEERRSSDVLSVGGTCSETTYQPASDSEISDTESVAFSVAENVLTSPPESPTLNINASAFVPASSLSFNAQATPFVPGTALASVPPPPGLRTALSTKARAYNPARS